MKTKTIRAPMFRKWYLEKGLGYLHEFKVQKNKKAGGRLVPVGLLNFKKTWKEIISI